MTSTKAPKSEVSVPPEDAAIPETAAVPQPPEDAATPAPAAAPEIPEDEAATEAAAVEDPPDAYARRMAAQAMAFFDFVGAVRNLVQAQRGQWASHLLPPADAVIEKSDALLALAPSNDPQED